MHKHTRFFFALVCGLLLSLCTVQAQSSSFSDVPLQHWAYQDIETFVQLEIIGGRGDGTFAPADSVTREEFAKMLLLTFRGVQSRPPVPTFADVPPERWSYGYIESAKDYLTGYSSPLNDALLFSPTTVATREDVAVALVRMMGLSGEHAYNPYYASYRFSDGNTISRELVPYVSLALERNLLQGFEDGTFRPQAPVTRAEVVTLLQRATKHAVGDTLGEALVLTAEVAYGYSAKEATLTIHASEGANVTVDGEAIQMERAGKYYGSVGKPYVGTYFYKFEEEGSRTFTITATKLQQTKTISITAQYEEIRPVLQIKALPAQTNQQYLSIEGKATHPKDRDISIFMNGTLVGSNTFLVIEQLSEGKNTFRFEAITSQGKHAEAVEYTVDFLSLPPTLTVEPLPDSTNQAYLIIKGSAKDDNDNTVSLYLDGVYQSDQSFTQLVALQEGMNTFTITARNDLGKETSQTKTVVYLPNSPSPEA